MYNVKVVASKVPLTVGGNVHTIFGRKKSGENLHFLACMHAWLVLSTKKGEMRGISP